jgi:hypothetical protein
LVATVCAIVGLVSAVTLGLRTPPTAEFSPDDFQYGVNYRAELANIPTVAQETDHTCYAAALVIVKNYLGAATTEDELLSQLGLSDRAQGMLPNEFATYASKALEPMNVSVTQAHPDSPAEALNLIADSLEQGFPTIVFYAAEDDWHRPHFNTHYAVVYGLDLANQELKLSNPYGYVETLSFAEFFAGLDFSNYQDEPFGFRLARLVGMVDTNTVFILAPTPQA